MKKGLFPCEVAVPETPKISPEMVNGNSYAYRSKNARSASCIYLPSGVTLSDVEEELSANSWGRQGKSIQLQARCKRCPSAEVLKVVVEDSRINPSTNVRLF